MLRGFGSDPRNSVLNAATAHARLHDVEAAQVEVSHPHPNRVIRRMARSGAFDLVVLGGELRQDSEKFLGPRTSALVRSIRVPLLLIAK